MRTDAHTLPRLVVDVSGGTTGCFAYAARVVAVLLLALAASPELPFELPGPRVLAPGQTYDVTSASSTTSPVSLVVWVAMGRMGIDVPSVYASRVQPFGNTDDPEGLLISQPFGRDPSVAWVPTLGAWVVAWEYEGSTFVRVVQLDGSIHPATSSPINLATGRAPQVVAASGGYFVASEAILPVVWWVQQPATPVVLAPLTSPTLPYATPVRSYLVTPPAPALLSSWVQGGSLWSQRATFSSGAFTTTMVVSQPLPAGRVDLDGVVGLPSGAGRVLYRVSDGGVTTLNLGWVNAPTVPPLVLDAGAVVTDNAALAEFADGTLAITSTQVDGRGLGWRLFTDGGFVGAGTLTTGTSRLAVATFGPAMGSAMLLSATYNDGLLAQPVSTSLASLGPPVQLSRSRAGHRYSQVASWSGGAIAVYQRLTALEAVNVAWRVFPDGGHAATPDLELNASRFDTPSVTSVGGSGVALLSGLAVRQLDLSGSWGPAVTIPRQVVSATVTTDRAQRVVVVGTQELSDEEIAWAFRLEPSGSFTERLLFPQASPKAVRPKLAMSRDGGFGLAIINPDAEVWGTRLTSDLVAQDDGGFRISGATVVDPFVVSDELGGFLVVYTDGFNVLVRRVVGAAAGGENLVLMGDWDIGNVIEVTGGAAVVATSRTTGEVVTLFLSVGGAVTGSVQSVVPAGSPTNSVGLAVGQDSLTWVFGRYDADAGAATSRSVVASRGIGAQCQWSWQCASGLCVVPVGCRPGIVPFDGGLVDPDAGVGLDAGGFDAGFVDAGFADAGSIDAGSVDAGSVDAGAVDAGDVDSGVADAGAVDAGDVDSGVIDAGEVDAGAIDAGALDAGVPSLDAGVAAPVDGGPQPTSTSYRAGCDCQTGTGPWLISALLVFLSARRRPSPTARGSNSP